MNVTTGGGHRLGTAAELAGHSGHWGDLDLSREPRRRRRTRIAAEEREARLRTLTVVSLVLNLVVVVVCLVPCILFPWMLPVSICCLMPCGCCCVAGWYQRVAEALPPLPEEFDRERDDSNRIDRLLTMLGGPGTPSRSNNNQNRGARSPFNAPARCPRPVFPDEDVVDRELKCIICLKPLHQPVNGPCQHSFCYECIMLWIRETPVCPVCRDPVDSHDLTRSILADSMLRKQTVKCHMENCQWEGLLDVFPSHARECDPSYRAETNAQQANTASGTRPTPRSRRNLQDAFDRDIAAAIAESMMEAGVDSSNNDSAAINVPENNASTSLDDVKVSIEGTSKSTEDGGNDAADTTKNIAISGNNEVLEDNHPQGVAGERSIEGKGWLTGECGATPTDVAHASGDSAQACTASSLEDATPVPELAEGEESCKVNLRLPNGAVQTLSLSTATTVKQLYAYARYLAKEDLGGKPFELAHVFPPSMVALSDERITESGVVESLLVVRAVDND